ncbi:MAG: FxLYD domain-containing protein [Bryobacteraceae bacterium]
MRWLGPLRGPLERFLFRPAPSDPLYLSNRTFDQKVKLGLVIAVPCLILAGIVLLGLSNIFQANEPGPAPEPSAAELAAKLLPNVDKTIKIEVNKDIEVLEAHIENDKGMKAAGLVKNVTDHVIHSAEIVLNVTDGAGSHLGAVSARVDNLAPGATVKFETPIPQKDAAFALVREVVTK